MSPEQGHNATNILHNLVCNSHRASDLSEIIILHVNNTKY